jgi:LysM repeat protein
MKSFGWFIICFFTLSATAQDRLVVSGTGTNLYVTKIMTGPQSLSSVSDQYNVPLSALAKFNGLNINFELRKGEEVKIPLNRDNFFQRNIYGKFQPVYHIFKAGETLVKLAVRFNKINIDSLKNWNNLPDEIVTDSKPLTIGFISNKKAQFSSAAYQAIAYDTLPNPNVLDAAKFGAKELKGELKPKPVPVPQPPAVLPVAVASSAIQKQTVVKSETANNDGFLNKKPLLVAPTLVQTEGDFSYRPRSNDEGFFAHTYNMRIKDRAYQAITGDASIFKTISGWNDRKFYVLINEIIPGTIVRITSTNKKSICAKVLGPLPETKGAAGLVIRMSNAAAAALGVEDQRFIVSITYVEY